MANYSAFLECNKTSRKYLQTKIKVDGGSFYSNGVIGVYVDGEAGGNEEAPQDSIERINRMIGKCIRYNRDTKTLPDVEFEEKLCEKCKGSGVTDECPECDGVGEVYFDNCHSDYVCDCNTCEGAGKNYTCDLCDGAKISTKQPESVSIDGVTFNPKYIKMINESLDNPKYCIDGDIMNIFHDHGCAVLMRTRDSF